MAVDMLNIIQADKKQVKERSVSVKHEDPIIEMDQPVELDEHAEQGIEINELGSLPPSSPPSARSEESDEEIGNGGLENDWFGFGYVSGCSNPYAI